MGQCSSGRARIIDAEENRWQVSHTLNYIPAQRSEQLLLLDNFKSPLKLACESKVLPGRVEYLHYFVTDSIWTIEFGDGSCDLNSSSTWARIHDQPHQSLTVEKRFELTEDVKSRMASVCGASNYSLGLRNSEHFARYICSGTWYSLQMTGESDLFQKIAPFMGPGISMVNTLPGEFCKTSSNATLEPLYTNWRSPHVQPQFCRQLQCLTPGDGDVNLLILGPTGAGKSSIVNILFNQQVAVVRPGVMSVTRQMEVYQGTCVWQGESRRINVIDSMGFCDSVIPPAEVVRLVKQFIKTNVLWLHKVLIVCAGRIETEQAAAIRNFMTWLGYKNHKSEFVFVYNKAECLTEGEKLQCIGQMCHLLEADSRHSVVTTIDDNSSTEEKIRVVYAMATGFPPKAPLGEVQDSMDALYNAAFLFRADAARLMVSDSCPVL